MRNKSGSSDATKMFHAHGLHLTRGVTWRAPAKGGQDKKRPGTDPGETGSVGRCLLYLPCYSGIPSCGGRGGTHDCGNPCENWHHSRPGAGVFSGTTPGGPSRKSVSQKNATAREGGGMAVGHSIGMATCEAVASSPHLYSAPKNSLLSSGVGLIVRAPSCQLAGQTSPLASKNRRAFTIRRASSTLRPNGRLFTT